MGKRAQPGTKHARYDANPMVQTFMLRLKQWRHDKGLTLKVVSQRTGFSMAIICEWEHGHRFPSVHHLSALSKFTRIPAHEFLRPVPDRTPRPTPHTSHLSPASHRTRAPHQSAKR